MTDSIITCRLDFAFSLFVLPIVHGKIRSLNWWKLKHRKHCKFLFLKKGLHSLWLPHPFSDETSASHCAFVAARSTVHALFTANIITDHSKIMGGHLLVCVAWRGTVWQSSVHKTLIRFLTVLHAEAVYCSRHSGRLTVKTPLLFLSNRLSGLFCVSYPR